MLVEPRTAPTQSRSPTSWRLRSLQGLPFFTFPWNLFWDQRAVLLTLVRTQISRRHRRSLLGWAWNVIQPGSQALLLFAATRGALHLPTSSSPLGGFGIFFAAYIIGQGMGEIVGRGPSLVAERAAWVKGSLFPLELLAPTAVGVALYRIIPGGLLGVMAVVVGDGVFAGLATLAAFALGLALAIIWGTTLALAFSAIGVYLRDAILAAPVITLGIIFVSPLYVDPSQGGLLGLALKLNPLTVSMDLVLSGGPWIVAHPIHFLSGVVSSFASLWLAATLFRRMAANFADYI
ncbi:MAG TPA: ABC transporter permease [Candidatus Dormibacteraeota bacterium]|nr:ABC transporter permease [Candidatus Dormibacteraeota bacterium]